MNSDPNRAELTKLQGDLQRVEMDLRFLRVKAEQLEARIAESERAQVKVAEVQQRIVQPPPLPPQPAPIPEPVFVEAPPIIPQEQFETYSAPQTQVEPPPPSVIAQEEAAPASFEMRLGTYWFVRIGIVMVLTAMVFLGNYAYQHYIGLLGPWGKLAMMYLGSFALLAAGKWLPRKQERLKNYGQVLFAGGLAAVYFTTYAAHHFPNLRVIESAVVDGILLLGWTAFIVWLADRRKSELMAALAIGLAYYTGLITNVGSFTLLSNLTLAAAAVFFLVRNRWVTLKSLSIAASYGSYFYWRHFAPGGGIDENAARWAICGYWLIFTAAVFLSRGAEFSGKTRATFLSFNNGAAFALLTVSFLQQHDGNFWKLAMASGVILLALAAAARKWIAEDDLPRRAYLAQGLLLVTLGFITKLSGPTLALVLAVESAALLIFSTQWKSRLLQTASMLVALMASAWLLVNIKNGDPLAWGKSGGVLALLLFNAAWSGKKILTVVNAGELRPLPAFFTALGLLTWSMAVFGLAHADRIGPILAATTLGLVALQYPVRVREIVLLGQIPLAIAQGQILIHVLRTPVALAWNPVCVILITVALAVWWKRQRIVEADENGRLLLQIVCAFAAAGIAYAWLPQEFTPDTWIYVAVALTIGWTIFGGAVRSWPLAAAGQMFIVGTAFLTFGRLVDQREPALGCAVALIAAFVALGAAARAFRTKVASGEVLGAISNVYQWVAAVLALASVYAYVVPGYRFIALAMLFAVSLIAAMMGARYAFGPGVMLAAAGLFFMLASFDTIAQWQNFVALGILAGAQVALRHTPGKMPIGDQAHHAWITVVACAIWLYVSQWVIAHSGGAHFYLTASWALLAFVFFGMGFGLRERAYRWIALTVLGCALVRVVALDVWRLQTIYRILSFLALGIVLLVLGYFYTRFQERIAKWL